MGEENRPALGSMEYNKTNRTQHASQRCGPRWVILILWEMVFKMEHSVFHFVKESIISVRMLYHMLLVRPPTH